LASAHSSAIQLSFCSLIEGKHEEANVMNKLLAGAAAAAFVCTISPVAAQPASLPPSAGAPVVQTRVMMRSDKVMTRDEMVAHVREMFGKLDTNRDGFLTREEVDAAHHKMAGEFGEKLAKGLAMRSDLPKPDRGAMFDRLDTNKDGMISREEFMAGHSEIREQHVFVMRNGEDPVELGAGHVPGTPEGPTRVTIMQDGQSPVEVGGAPGQPKVKVMRMHGMGMGMHGKMFETADANHDGKVSLQEMTAAALQHFDAADTNHDGKLSPEERMQMHPRVKVEHMQPA